MKVATWVILACALFGGAAGAAQATNLIVDGGFESPVVPSGSYTLFGLGQTFLGTLKVTTGANGVATINTTFARTFRSGTFITATATLPGSGTSEFSKCLQVP